MAISIVWVAIQEDIVQNVTGIMKDEKLGKIKVNMTKAHRKGVL